MLALGQILAHLFNLIYVLAFMVKDIMWLRIVMLVGGSVELYVDYTYSYTVNLYWCGFMMVVNSVQLVILIRERMNLNFTEEEKKLHRMVFNSLKPVEVKKLLKAGSWNDIDENTVMIEENTKINRLMVIYEGTAAVQAKNKVIAYLRDGSFAGEMSFLTGNPTAAKVFSVTPLKYISWEKDKLEELMNKVPEIQSGLHKVFNTDLVSKINKQNLSVQSQNS